jgi:hypothetical protein
MKALARRMGHYALHDAFSDWQEAGVKAPTSTRPASVR